MESVVGSDPPDMHLLVLVFGRSTKSLRRALSDRCLEHLKSDVYRIVVEKWKWALERTK